MAAGIDGDFRRIGVGEETASEEVWTPEPDDTDTIYDLFKAEVSKKVVKQNKKFRLPARENIEIEIDPNVDFDTYDAWVKRAGKGKKNGELDYMKLANSVLSNRCVGIWMKGVQVLDKETKEPLTLADPAFHRIIGAPIGGTIPAIKHLIGSEGDVVNITRLAIKAMGYTLDDEDSYESEDDPLPN